MSYQHRGRCSDASSHPFAGAECRSVETIHLAPSIAGRRRRATRTTLSILLGACLVLGSVVAGRSPALAAPKGGDGTQARASTHDGVVEGFVQNGVSTYLGIPYAAPPVGDLRWRPPQPVTPWRQPLQATSFGNHCPQLPLYDGFNTPSTTEDCLYLNVFAPKNNGGRPARGLPVMFWIYGGGFTGGESDDYDGSKLATQGNVVVVTINYRVGLLGLFAHPALTAEGHLVTNYEIMDQQFALQWVQRNIAAFGGDPGNVTIFGESAGGISVYVHLASPLSTGLFQRAIDESGAFASLLKSRSEATAEASGQAFAAKVGCADQSAACLRSLSVEQILANQGGFSTQPVIDGTLLPESLDTAFSTGRFNRVPTINGTNRDEYRWIVGQGFDLAGGPETAAGYQSFLSTTYGAYADLVAAQYPLGSYPSPDLALATLETDADVACSAEIVDDWLSMYVPTYAYEFHDPNPPIYLPPISFPWGASHTTELQFLFPGYHGGQQGLQHALSPEEKALSDRMVQYWTDFAWSGNPNSPLAPLWPRYFPQIERVQFLTPPNPMSSLSFAREHKCRFWNSLLGWPGNL